MTQNEDPAIMKIIKSTDEQVILQGYFHETTEIGGISGHPLYVVEPGESFGGFTFDELHPIEGD